MNFEGALALIKEQKTLTRAGSELKIFLKEGKLLNGTGDEAPEWQATSEDLLAGDWAEVTA